MCLTFTDNGNGMTQDKLYKMLSFGFSDKVAIKGNLPIGLYGNGFKSGSMRLGKDAIVFTKNKFGMHVGMLSQSYLEKINAEHVLVPIISFNNKKQLVQTPDSEANLGAITTYSLLNSVTELLAELDAIIGSKGTRIIIWSLRCDNSGNPEFDFDYDKYDIRIPAEIDGKKTDYKQQERVDQATPDCDYSLRAYCSILYLKPRMQIILRGQKVQTQLVAKSLALIEKDVYKPRTIASGSIKFTFGYNCVNKEHYGIMMYHKNRLIKAYIKVACQLKNKGVGVVGVVECNFLKPTHNKQDFDYTDEYRRTLNALDNKLSEYWNEMKLKKNSHYSSVPVEDIQKIPDQNWVQCDLCLKWRKVADAMGKLPNKWKCSMNTDPQFRECVVPEEPEDDDDTTHCTYEKTHKKRKSVQTLQMTPDKKSTPGTPQNKTLQLSLSSGQRDLEQNQETVSKSRKSEQLQQKTSDKPTILLILQNKRMKPSVRSNQRDFEPNQSQGMDISERKSKQIQQMTADQPTVQSTQQTEDMQPSVSSAQRDFEPNQGQGTDINKRTSEGIQQMTADQTAVQFTPQNEEIQPSVSSAPMDLEPNQRQGTNINKSCKHLLSYGNTSAKKQKLIGTETANLLQESNDDVIIIEDSGTSSDPVASENMNYELYVKKEGESNDCSSQENQQMPGSKLYYNGITQHDMGTTHQADHPESSKDTTDQEKERLKKYCGELFVKVKELEDQISGLSNKYEKSLKEIKNLKAECEVLRNLKTEPDTGPQEPAEDSSELDHMALQMDSLFRQLDACSTERDQYKIEVKQLKELVCKLRSSQVKKVSHQETQRDFNSPNTAEHPLGQLAVQHEGTLKEINSLKAECEVLQSLESEPGTGTQKPAEENSKVDDLVLQLDVGSTEQEEYKRKP
ncbi:MORC family CW-type zinc finger protein 3 isoform X2 [Xenopus laevis]|nr:MORC family CW-type zinc finger protein 3 isoform X2 [Xenopus laevis]